MLRICFGLRLCFQASNLILTRMYTNPCILDVPAYLCHEVWFTGAKSSKLSRVPTPAEHAANGTGSWAVQNTPRSRSLFSHAPAPESSEIMERRLSDTSVTFKRRRKSGEVRPSIWAASQYVDGVDDLVAAGRKAQHCCIRRGCCCRSPRCPAQAEHSQPNSLHLLRNSTFHPNLICGRTCMARPRS